MDAIHRRVCKAISSTKTGISCGGFSGLVEEAELNRLNGKDCSLPDDAIRGQPEEERALPGNRRESRLFLHRHVASPLASGALVKPSERR
jgi:hypothetical protein